MDHFLAADEDACEARHPRTLVTGVPTHVVATRREVTGFMNDELIWDVTRAVDS